MPENIVLMFALRNTDIRKMQFKVATLLGSYCIFLKILLTFSGLIRKDMNDNRANNPVGKKYPA